MLPRIQPINPSRIAALPLHLKLPQQQQIVVYRVAEVVRRMMLAW